jgi:hypothetical protein
MFNLDNVAGFTQSQCDLMNDAIVVLTRLGVDESNASDIVNNNWDVDGNNTIESLIAR